jgi:hypothetical protein
MLIETYLSDFIDKFILTHAISHYGPLALADMLRPYTQHSLRSTS